MAAVTRVIAAVTFAVLLWQPAHAVERTAEERIKAAFLFHFATFVEWPDDAFADAAAPIIVAVVGSPGIAEALEALVDGRTAQGRPLRVESGRGAEERAHMLFVGRTAAAALPTLVDANGGRPVLVVTEVPGGIAHGATIELLVVDDRVRFDVAVDHATARGLRISSRMLEVARRVVRAR